MKRSTLTSLMSSFVVVVGAAMLSSEPVVAAEAAACVYEHVDACGTLPNGASVCMDLGHPFSVSFCQSCDMGPEFCEGYPRIVACCY